MKSYPIMFEDADDVAEGIILTEDEIASIGVCERLVELQAKAMGAHRRRRWPRTGGDNG